MTGEGREVRTRKAGGEAEREVGWGGVVVSGASLRGSKPRSHLPWAPRLSKQTGPSGLTVSAGWHPGAVWLSLCSSTPQERDFGTEGPLPGDTPTGLSPSGPPETLGCPHPGSRHPGTGDEERAEASCLSGCLHGLAHHACCPFLLVFAAESLAQLRTLKERHAACFGVLPGEEVVGIL